MKHIAILALTASLGLSAATALAAPPVDLEQGEAALSLGVSISPDLERSDSQFGSVDLDSDSKFYGGLAVGLGGPWSFSANYFTNEGDLRTSLPAGPPEVPDSPAPETASLGYNLKVKSYDFNLHYKFSPYLSGLLGYTHDKAEGSLSLPGLSVSNSSSHSGHQIGLAGQYPLSEKLDAWAFLAFGNKRNTQELGVSYAFSENLRSDLSYAWYKYKDFSGYPGSEVTLPDFDVKADGLRLGLTYLF